LYGTQRQFISFTTNIFKQLWFCNEYVGDPSTWLFCSGLPFVAASSHQPFGAPLDSATPPWQRWTHRSGNATTIFNKNIIIRLYLKHLRHATSNQEHSYAVITFQTKIIIKKGNPGKKYWPIFLSYDIENKEMATPKMFLLLNAYSLPLERVY
jgi:hypothetical protein